MKKSKFNLIQETQNFNTGEVLEIKETQVSLKIKKSWLAKAQYDLLLLIRNYAFACNENNHNNIKLMNARLVESGYIDISIEEGKELILNRILKTQAYIDDLLSEMPSKKKDKDNFFGLLPKSKDYTKLKLPITEYILSSL